MIDCKENGGSYDVVVVGSFQATHCGWEKGSRLPGSCYLRACLLDVY